jgi:hypothetical protein
MSEQGRTIVSALHDMLLKVWSVATWPACMNSVPLVCCDARDLQENGA